jgi:hypothetical protein
MRNLLEHPRFCNQVWNAAPADRTDAEVQQQTLPFCLALALAAQESQQVARTVASYPIGETRQTGRVVATLTGEVVSAQTVSRITQDNPCVLHFARNADSPCKSAASLTRPSKSPQNL